MTVATPPWAIQASSHPATAVRQANQGQMQSPVGAFAGGIQPTTGGGGHGVCSATDLSVSQHSTPNMSVDITSGLVAIRGTENASQGVYGPCYNDALVVLTIAAADPTNARKDLVVARIRDAQYSGASNDFALVVVTGTPSGSPVDPAVPADSVVIARVNVAALAASIVNANITDLRPRAYALRSPGLSVAALVASSPAQGQEWYVSDAAVPTGAVAPQTSGRPNAPGFYIWDQRWDPPWNLPWGIMGYAQVVANQTGITVAVDLTSLAVTFTPVANRRIRISFQCEFQSTVADDEVLVGILKDGAQITRGIIGCRVVNNDYTVEAAIPDTPSAGAHTYKLNAVRVVGTGTLRMTASATAPAWILVEDLGPNGSPV